MSGDMPVKVRKWYRALMADRRIPDAPRVAGLALAEDADGNGHVSVDRQRLAKRLGGLYLSRVDERLKVLRDRGWLQAVSGPGPGKHAVWALVIVCERAPVEPVQERAPETRGTFTPAEPVHVAS
jgi:hypothetical protein